MKSGIYSITISNKVYVGSAKSISNRKSKHKNDLRLNIHSNRYLQAAYDQYKEFIFNVIEYCEPEKLIEREQFYLDSFNCVNPNGYNITPNAGSKNGFKHSEETKQRIGIGNKGKIISEETRIKLSERFIGRIITEHQRKAIYEANKKRKGIKYNKLKITIMEGIVLD